MALFIAWFNRSLGLGQCNGTTFREIIERAQTETGIRVNEGEPTNLNDREECRKSRDNATIGQRL